MSEQHEPLASDGDEVVDGVVPPNEVDQSATPVDGSLTDEP
jgi:hypothetical protein